MAFVQRANVVLEIADTDDEISFYLKKGYNLIDENGKILREARPSDLDSYKAAYKTATEKIRNLEKKNTELKNEINILSEQLRVLKKKKQQ